MSYSSEHDVIARLKSNGALFAIVSMDAEHVTIQGWQHRDTLTARDFAIRFEVRKVRNEVQS